MIEDARSLESCLSPCTSSSSLGSCSDHMRAMSMMNVQLVLQFEFLSLLVWRGIGVF